VLTVLPAEYAKQSPILQEVQVDRRKGLSWLKVVRDATVQYCTVVAVHIAWAPCFGFITKTINHICTVASTVQYARPFRLI
jgi:hypothetical protein